MKPTEKASLWAVAGGLVVAGGIYWLLEGAAWWLPPLAGFIVAALAYNQIVKDMAAESSANRELNQDKG